MIFFYCRPTSPNSTLFPYTTLFRSLELAQRARAVLFIVCRRGLCFNSNDIAQVVHVDRLARSHDDQPFDRILEFPRSEEHTSELQSRGQLVCRLLLEKKHPPPGAAP